ncbi:MAG TPA: 3',5'-cyclic-nucleotide phosphodiesterase [Deltaproteobacteria bacterium]|jgi:ribonuclease BN (tRNA processing enzyme)|nr:3',5'-cyclic-nucleotide phosphodiesterase [Deltaproteobacteria bacterium]HOI07919.1 3',5'-cyclic-nucleotide phosphodiesterase [Deltaproteobacteria bacterium]
MKIEILGCSGSVMQGYNTTSILVNGNVLVDAGSAASALPAERLCGIGHILVTHPHIDHVKELPFILETLFSREDHVVTVWGSRVTLEALTGNIFNGVIWPRITELNNYKDFVLFREVPDHEFPVGGLAVSGFRAEHIPGSLSYLLSDGESRVLFSGDTGSDRHLFDLVKSLGPSLKALFVEVSFPNRMEDFARLTRHLTPSLLEEGLDGLAPESVRIIAYHIKPKYIDEVVAELPPNVAYITGGEVFQF